MAGTTIGGQRANQTTRKRHGKNFYKRIGAIGGSRTSQSKGFGYRKECKCDIFDFGHTIPMCAGAKGGRTSRRR
jgi:hypothetical protein